MTSILQESVIETKAEITDNAKRENRLLTAEEKDLIAGLDVIAGAEKAPDIGQLLYEAEKRRYAMLDIIKGK